MGRPQRRHAARAAFTWALGLGLASLALLTLTDSPSKAFAQATTPPNIVVITTDDQTHASLDATSMPNVTRLLAGEGTTFTDAVATTPLCCPSRASWLTGQYSHNHGARSNNPGYAALKDPTNVLPAWLQRAGYRTVHIGKFMNGYDDAVPVPAQPAPGWDEWHTMLEPRRYYNYDLSVNGSVVHFGYRDRDYLTRVLNRTAVDLIGRYMSSDRPLYLQLDHFAPHWGGPDPTKRCTKAPIPDQLDRSLFLSTPLPRPPSFNETDMSDKPSFMRQLPPLSSTQISAIQTHYRCERAALKAVDRGIADIYAALKAAGALERTIIVFTNDNGWYYGQHRLDGGKTLAYEEGVRVPLLIRAPTELYGPRVPTVGKPVGNIDLAPTVLAAAGGAPCISETQCRVMDGRSLLGLLQGDESGWPAARGVLIEFKKGKDTAAETKTCAYEGVRAASQVFLRHTSVPNPSTGACQPANEVEHYDLVADPFQIRNLYPPTNSANQQKQQQFAARLTALRNCSGIAGRDPAPPPGVSYCE
jgi:N-acetylglucosamine-6-sulfatase